MTIASRFMLQRVSVTQRGGNTWRLDRPVMFYDQGVTYYVPEGYVTDFASVPRPVWWLVPPSGSYTAAAIVHDWLITDKLRRGGISSRRVDRVFREAMRALGVSVPRRWLMWAGVRLGALGNPRRRRGSLATLPGVLLISALALPLVLPALAVLPSLVLFGLIERLSRR